jgi:hypothetical protein
MVVRVARRKYGAFRISTRVIRSPATFRGVKKSLTLDISCFLIDSALSLTTLRLAKFTTDSSVAFID